MVHEILDHVTEIVQKVYLPMNKIALLAYVAYVFKYPSSPNNSLYQFIDSKIQKLGDSYPPTVNLST